MNDPVSVDRLVFERSGEAWTDSRLVAETFEKRHDDVLKRIGNLQISQGFRARNFAESKYLDLQGKTQPCIEMSETGYSRLVMGFTGDKAAVHQETYCIAFAAMKQKLQSGLATLKDLYQGFDKVLLLSQSIFSNQVQLQSDVGIIKSDVCALKTEVGEVRGEVRLLKVEPKRWSQKDRRMMYACLVLYFNGRCACCRDVRFFDASGNRLTGRIPHIDHFDSRPWNSILKNGWPVCHDCNQKLKNPLFRNDRSHAFYEFQRALQGHQQERIAEDTTRDLFDDDKA